MNSATDGDGIERAAIAAHNFFVPIATWDAISPHERADWRALAATVAAALAEQPAPATGRTRPYRLPTHWRARPLFPAHRGWIVTGSDNQDGAPVAVELRVGADPERADEPHAATAIAHFLNTARIEAPQC